MSTVSRRFFVITLILSILFLTVSLQSSAQHYAIVKSSDVNVRSGPDKSYTVKDVAKKGDTVAIISESKGWSQVTTSKNIDGYIATSFLEKFGNDASPIPPIKERSSNWWVILLVIIALFLLGRRLQESLTPRKKQHLSPKQAYNKPMRRQTYIPVSAADDALAKTIAKKSGDDFEDFIAEKIGANSYFKLKHWRSDKISREQRISAESNKYPDFEVLFKLRHANELIEHVFAIECKWRRNFLNGSLHIDSWQINNYKAYAKRENMKVYIILGYGGDPTNPERLYLIPLDHIASGDLSAMFLKQYEHQADETFYYAPEKRELKLLPVH